MDLINFTINLEFKLVHLINQISEFKLRNALHYKFKFTKLQEIQI